MRCVQRMSVATQDYEDEQLRAHSRVTQVCHVIVGFHVLRVDVSLDLCFHVVIGVGRLTVQQGFIRQLHFTTHTQFQVQSSFFWMLQSDFVLSSSTQSVSQILAYFTSRKRVFEVLSLHTPSVTVDRRQL